MSNFGFIGLGIMGRPMAGPLIAGGHTLFVHDLAPAPRELLDGGATPCANAAEVARAADVVIVMVPDTPHVEAALFGPDGVAAALAPGKIVVDMSSIAPIPTRTSPGALTSLAATTSTRPCRAATTAPRPPA